MLSPQKFKLHFERLVAVFYGSAHNAINTLTGNTRKSMCYPTFIRMIRGETEFSPKNVINFLTLTSAAIEGEITRLKLELDINNSLIKDLTSSVDYVDFCVQDHLNTLTKDEKLNLAIAVKKLKLLYEDKE